MSLPTHLARSARYFNRSALLLPTRSLTRIQRGKSVAQAAGKLSLSSTVGGSGSGSARYLSLWSPWSSPSSPKPEAAAAQVPPPEPVEAQAASALAPASPPEVVDSTPLQPDASLLASTPTPPPGIAVDAVASAAVPSLSDTAASTLATLTPTTPLPDLTALGLTGLSPAGLCISLLDVLHTTLHLPWWASITLLTLTTRTALLPLLLSAQKTQARLSPIQPALALLRLEMTEAQREKDLLKLQKAGMQQRRLMSEAGVNPIAPVLNGVVQVCVQLGCFLGVRRVCTAPELVGEMQVGGVGWIVDLSAADPTYVLPVVNTLLVNAQLYLSRRDALASGNPTTIHILNGMRILSLLSLPFMATFPAGLNLHLGCSLAFVVVQTVVLHRPGVRARVGLPALPAVGGRGATAGATGAGATGATGAVGGAPAVGAVSATGALTGAGAGVSVGAPGAAPGVAGAGTEMPTLLDTLAYARAALRNRYAQAAADAQAKEAERERKMRMVRKR